MEIYTLGQRHLLLFRNYQTPCWLSYSKGQFTIQWFSLAGCHVSCPRPHKRKGSSIICRVKRLSEWLIHPHPILQWITVLRDVIQKFRTGYRLAKNSIKTCDKGWIKILSSKVAFPLLACLSDKKLPKSILVQSYQSLYDKLST